MNEYQFNKCSPKLEIDLPEHIPFFLRPEFVNRNGTENLHCFSIERNKNLIAYAHFKIERNKAICLPNSPLGGIVTLSKIEEAVIAEFIYFIISYLCNIETQEIEIRLCPDCYNIYGYEAVLLTNGFYEKNSDTNQHLEINEKNFRSKLNADKKNRLNLSEKANFVSRILKNEELKEAYEIIAENLVRKGFPITFNWNEIEKSTASFHDKYLAFGTFDNNKLIASSMAVKINQKILYNFYHGYQEPYSKFSPLVATIEAEYYYASAHGFELIDMGISSVKGELNQGLYNFKRSVGAIEGYKKTFVYKQ